VYIVAGCPASSVYALWSGERLTRVEHEKVFICPDAFVVAERTDSDRILVHFSRDPPRDKINRDRDERPTLDCSSKKEDKKSEAQSLAETQQISRAVGNEFFHFN
jgi:hypothetical protein